MSKYKKKNENGENIEEEENDDDETTIDESIDNILKLKRISKENKKISYKLRF